jgi:hypothetical protein
VPSGIVAMEYDLVAREMPRAQMSDELRPLDVAQRTEDRHARKDARDRFGVYGADDTPACV